MKQKFRFDTDGSGHWYLIPEEFYEDFQGWANQDDEHSDVEFKDFDKYRMDGHPCGYVFENPVYD